MSRTRARHGKSGVVRVVASAMAIASLVACSSSSDGTTTPSPSSSGSSGKPPSSLSLSFASRCARCHGTTATGQGIYPSLPGKLSEPEFVAVVRNGRNEMPSFEATEISDADLASDYAWMTTQR